MANEISIYEPRYLAEVVRTTPLVRTFFLDNYFTNVKTFATKSVDIDVVKGDRRMASFVHPLVGGQVLKNEGYQTESFTPPLINPLTVTTANDALERMPGEDLYSGMTPEERAKPELLQASRKRRIAAGCGMKVEDVNRLCNQLKQMQKLMKQFGGKKGKKMMARMGGMGGFGGPDMGGMGGFPM